MTEGDTRSARLSNYAMLASLILRSREEARYRATHGKPAAPLQRNELAWLTRMRDLLLTSGLGAQHVANVQFNAPEPSPAPDRSLSDELEIYDVVMDLNRGITGPSDLVSWVDEASQVIDTVKAKGWGQLERSDEVRVERTLLPFLERLANLEGDALAVVGSRDRGERPTDAVVA